MCEAIERNKALLRNEREEILRMARAEAQRLTQAASSHDGRLAAGIRDAEARQRRMAAELQHELALHEVHARGLLLEERENRPAQRSSMP